MKTLRHNSVLAFFFCLVILFSSQSFAQRNNFNLIAGTTSYPSFVINGDYSTYTLTLLVNIGSGNYLQVPCSKTYTSPNTTARCTLYASYTRDLAAGDYNFNIYGFGPDTLIVAAGYMKIIKNVFLAGVPFIIPRYTIMLLDEADYDTTFVIGFNEDSTWREINIDDVRSVIGGGSAVLPDSVVFAGELGDTAQALREEAADFVTKSTTQEIPGEKDFSASKTVFRGDSVGVRGNLDVDGTASVGALNIGNTGFSIWAGSQIYGIALNNFQLSVLSGLEITDAPSGFGMGYSNSNLKIGSSAESNAIRKSQLKFYMDSLKIIAKSIVSDDDTLRLDATVLLNGNVLTTGGSFGNADSLGGEPAANYVTKAGINTWSTNLYSGSENVMRLGKSYADRRFNNGAYSDVWIIDYVVPPYNLSASWLFPIEHRTDYYNDTLQTISSVANIFYIDTTGSGIWKTNDVNISGVETQIGVGDLPDSTGLVWANAGLYGNRIILSEANLTATPKRFPMKVKGYSFDIGTNAYYTYPELYSYYSNLATGNLERAWHFYGEGDYPSYFGGDLQVAGVVVANGDTLGTGSGDTTHVVAFNKVIGLQDSIDEKANTSHIHIITEVTKLQDSLDVKLNRDEYSAGSGDMTKAVYDVDDDGTVDDTDSLGGVAASSYATKTAVSDSIDAYTVEGTANNQFMHYDLGNGWIAQSAAAQFDSMLKSYTKDVGDIQITEGSFEVEDNSHAHTIANVTALQDSLDDKLNRSEYAPGGSTDTTFIYNTLDSRGDRIDYLEGLIASLIESVEGCCDLSDNIPPTPPDDYLAIGGTSETQYVTTWTDPTEFDLDSLRWYEGSSSDTTTWTWITSIGAGVETYTRTGRTANTTYWSGVKAIDDSGNVSWFSNIDSAKTLAAVMGSEILADDFEDGNVSDDWDAYTHAGSNTISIETDSVYAGTYSAEWDWDGTNVNNYLQVTVPDLTKVYIKLELHYDGVYPAGAWASTDIISLYDGATKFASLDMQANGTANAINNLNIWSEGPGGNVLPSPNFYEHDWQTIELEWTKGTGSDGTGKWWIRWTPPGGTSYVDSSTAVTDANNLCDAIRIGTTSGTAFNGTGFMRVDNIEIDSTSQR